MAVKYSCRVSLRGVRGWHPARMDSSILHSVAYIVGGVMVVVEITRSIFVIHPSFIILLFDYYFFSILFFLMFSSLLFLSYCYGVSISPLSFIVR